VATALGELNCTYEQYCEMTWAEFQLRLFSYKRVNKEKWEMLRLLMYNNTVAPHRDPKRIPKSINSFMQIGSSKKISDAQLNAIKKAQEQYHERKIKS